MPDLTVEEIQRNVGALVLQLWTAGKLVADLQQRLVEAKTTAPPAEGERAATPADADPIRK